MPSALGIGSQRDLGPFPSYDTPKYCMGTNNGLRLAFQPTLPVSLVLKLWVSYVAIVDSTEVSYIGFHYVLFCCFQNIIWVGI